MKLTSLFVLALGLAVVTGCGQQASQDDASPVAEVADGESQVAGELPEGESMHGGWWCYEHAVPEEQCAMCNIKLAAELREQGDWCEEHNRPDSLCFKCHPENAQPFAALYEAKYGKKPPEATD